MFPTIFINNYEIVGKESVSKRLEILDHLIHSEQILILHHLHYPVHLLNGKPKDISYAPMSA